MKKWSSVKEQFAPEGTLRDVYVNNIDVKDWDNLIEGIKQSSHKFEFYHGEFKLVLPECFKSIRLLQESNPTTLKLFLSSGIQINCHFFVEEEIEMDIDPRDIANESKFSELLSFLKWLALVVDKPVYLTHENTPSQVILNVQP